jgi:hypothetical protein
MAINWGKKEDLVGKQVFFFPSRVRSNDYTLEPFKDVKCIIIDIRWYSSYKSINKYKVGLKCEISPNFYRHIYVFNDCIESVFSAQPTYDIY